MTNYHTEFRTGLLTLGNKKLGDCIHVFSLPAIDSCPGRSKLCESACYAMKGHLLWQQTKGSYQKKFEFSRRRHFSKRMIEEIRFRDVRILRIHVSGDFYDAAYVRKWIEIVKACPKTKFFVYTRSWRIAKILPELNELAKLRNIRVWFSCDRETGVPTGIGKRVRLAYMAVSDDDVPEIAPDLAFRVKRKEVVKRMGGVLVCPVENGSGAKTNCQKCSLCWGSLTAKDPREHRLALTVL